MRRYVHGEFYAWYGYVPRKIIIRVSEDKLDL